MSQTVRPDARSNFLGDDHPSEQPIIIRRMARNGRKRQYCRRAHMAKPVRLLSHRLNDETISLCAYISHASCSLNTPHELIPFPRLIFQGWSPYHELYIFPPAFRYCWSRYLVIIILDRGRSIPGHLEVHCLLFRLNREYYYCFRFSFGCCQSKA